MDLRRQAVAGRLQHRRPEQRVEVGDVLADEVVDLGLVAPPPVVEIFPLAVAPLAGRADVPDRGVEPDVPVVARRVGNLEAEVRRRSRNVPVAERLVQKMALQVVGHFRLKVLAALRPLGEEIVQLFDLDEQMCRRTDLGRRARKRAHRVLQIGGRVRVAVVATVAVLVFQAAERARPLDEPVGQERAGLGVVKLRDLLLVNQSRLANRRPNFLADGPVFGAVGAAVVVELDLEPGEVLDVRLAHPLEQLLLRNAFALRPDHDRRAVGVVGTDIDAAVAAELLEPHPNVGLDVLDQVADMDMPVGVGQGAGDEDLALSHVFSGQTICRPGAGPPVARNAAASDGIRRWRNRDHERSILADSARLVEAGVSGQTLGPAATRLVMLKPGSGRAHCPTKNCSRREPPRAARDPAAGHPVERVMH